MSDQAWCGTWSASGIFGDSKGNIYSFSYGDSRRRMLVRHCHCIRPSVVASQSYASIVCAEEKPLLSAEIASDARTVWGDVRNLIRHAGLW